MTELRLAERLRLRGFPSFPRSGATTFYDEPPRRSGQGAAVRNAVARSTFHYDTAKALFEKAVVLVEAGRNKDALVVYSQIIERARKVQSRALRGVLAAAFRNKAWLLAELNEEAEAVSTWREFLSDFGNSEEPGIRVHLANALFDKACFFWRIERREAAVAVYDEIFVRFKNDASAPLSETVAKALWNKVCVQNDDDLPPLEVLAVCNEILMRTEAFSGVSFRELTLNALRVKEICYSELNRRREQFAVFKKIERDFANETEPCLRAGVAETLLAKGRVLARFRRFSPAIRVFDDLNARFSKDTEYRVRLAVANALARKQDALHRLGENERSVEIADDILRRFGEDEDGEIRTKVAAALTLNLRALFHLGRFEELYSVTMCVLQLFGDDDDPLIRSVVLGALALARPVVVGELRRFADAIGICDHLITRFGEDTEPRAACFVAESAFDKARCLAALDRSAEALPVCDALITRLKGTEDGRLKGILRQTVAFRKEVVADIEAQQKQAANKTLLEHLVKARDNASIMNKPLVNTEISAMTQAFRFALTALKPADRRDTLAQYYAAGAENTWVKAKDDPPSPQRFLDWLNKRFPDRQDIGMVRADLKHLDPDAHYRLRKWAEIKSGIPRDVIESFGLPISFTRYDEARDANAPRTMAELRERVARGEDTEKNLKRAFSRRYMRELRS